MEVAQHNEAITGHQTSIGPLTVTLTSPTTGRVRTVEDVTVNRQLARIDAYFKVLHDGRVSIDWYPRRPFSRVYEPDAGYNAGHPYDGLADGAKKKCEAAAIAAATEAIQRDGAELIGRRAAVREALRTQELHIERLEHKIEALQKDLARVEQMRQDLTSGLATMTNYAGSPDEQTAILQAGHNGETGARKDAEMNHLQKGDPRYFELERQARYGREQEIDRIARTFTDDRPGQDYSDIAERAYTALHPGRVAYTRAYLAKIEELREGAIQNKQLV